jgi:hypothetical protein
MPAPFAPCEPECVILVHLRKIKTLKFFIMKTCKLIQCFLVLAGIWAVSALPVKADILTGPVTNSLNGHIYYLLITTNWTDSERQAVALGGHLATIRNAAEQDWIYTNFNFYAGLVRGLWIGLHDPDPVNNSSNRLARRSEFVWASGEPVTYSRWSSVEPNNPNSPEGFAPPQWEIYGHIWDRDDANAGTWNNFSDLATILGNRLNGVVEIDPSRLNIASLPQNRVLLYWSTWGSNYVLEGCANIGGAASWQTITNARASDGINLMVTNQAQGGGHFYRLRSP